MTVSDGKFAPDVFRNVYCVLGLPIDALEMGGALASIDAAAVCRAAFLISTPNLDFLVQSRLNLDFRESLLDSDLCLADGMPIIWIAKLIGLPIKAKVSGSDLFDALKSPERSARQLKVFLFGGGDGVAEAAAMSLNSTRAGLVCVGTLNPGFGTVAQMSREQILKTVNSSGADFLVVALGATKGQAWLHRNHYNLTVPVRVHLGAVINFQAGTISRAPRFFQVWGMEWLWRIKEEPQLWRRYLYGGVTLLNLLLTRVLPLAIVCRWHKLKFRRELLAVDTAFNPTSTYIRFSGAALEPNIKQAVESFEKVVQIGKKAVILDLSGLVAIDGRFFGLLLMLRKSLNGQGVKMRLTGISPFIRKMFRLHELEFLLEIGPDYESDQRI